MVEKTSYRQVLDSSLGIDVKILVFCQSSSLTSRNLEDLLSGKALLKATKGESLPELQWLVYITGSWSYSHKNRSSALTGELH